MSLADAITALASDVYAVTRPAPGGSYVDGRWVPAAGGETFDVPAVIEHISPLDLQRLPEGERSSDWIAVIVPVQLQTSDREAGRLSDRITVDGVDYELEMADAWRMPGVAVPDFCRALARKIKL